MNHRRTADEDASTDPKRGIRGQKTLTKEQRDIYRSMGPQDERFTLTFTTAAARDFIRFLNERRQEDASFASEIGAGLPTDPWKFEDDDADHVDSRTQARELALSVFDADREVFVILENELGDRGDPIYTVRMKDAASGAICRFSVAGKGDCSLIIGARIDNFDPPTQSVRWRSAVSFDEFGEVMPESLRRACECERTSSVIRADVEANLKLWDKFLDVEERAARKKQFAIAYGSRRTGDRTEIQKLSLELVPADVSDRLKHYRDFLEILPNMPSDESDTAYDQGVAKVRCVRYISASKVLEVRIEADSREEVEKIAKRIPAAGVVANRERGAMVNVRRQKHGIERLRHGHARLPGLDLLLYGPEDIALSPFPSGDEIELADFLRPDLVNEEQRIAVSAALATPDCFFLQGPPGTGKTTFISELVFQAVRRGERVLVSSQTNLAVDNALSRLEKRPEILAMRIGNKDSVEAEGQPFVGENAVRRWLEGVAKRARNRRAVIERLGRAYDRVVEHRALLDRWAKCGTPPKQEENLCVDDANARYQEIFRLKSEMAPLERGVRVARYLKEKIAKLRRSEKNRRTLAVRIEKLAIDGLRRKRLKGLPRVVKRLLDRIDRVESSFMSEGVEVASKPSQIGLLLSAWVAAERQGHEDKCERIIDALEAHFAELSRRSKKLLFGWLFRWRKNRDALLLSYAVGAVCNEIAGSDSLWPHVKSALQARASRFRDSARKLTAAAAKTQNKLDKLLDPTSDGVLSTFQRCLDDKLGPLGEFGGSDGVERLSAQWTRLESALEAASNDFACSLWHEFVAAGGARTLRPTVNALDEEVMAVGNPRGPGCPRQWHAQCEVLDAWARRIDSSDAVVDKPLMDAFDLAVNVVGATCSVTASRQFTERFRQFDYVIIDEVSKATPTELLLPGLLGKKLVLVGDHKQLHPYFGEESTFEDAAEELGLDGEEYKNALSKSIFAERFEWFMKNRNTIGPRALMLRKQYRMHSGIMAGINQFYDGSLQLGKPNLDEDRLHAITSVPWLDSKASVIWIDTPDEPEWHSSTEEGSTSSTNVKEAILVEAVVTTLAPAAKASGMSLGVISLYAGQSRLLQRMVHNQRRAPEDPLYGVRVSTVDRFQGMERDIVVVSLCANGRAPSGFLRKENRINVAMSRARRLLVIVGSSATSCRFAAKSSHYLRFLQIAKSQRGHIHANTVLESS